MSKYIKITPECIEECLAEFKKELTTSKWADGKINFSKTLGIISRKAKIFFTEEAWVKMKYLIKEFDNEVAWHGVAFRGEDETKDEYIIKDILVYPQKVTGASVEMDTEEYAKWIEINIEDERFCDIRMQGHSHVNMQVFASSVDLTHQEAILDQLSDKLFYIFMIWNKKGDRNVKIYDLAKNILFENTDIEIEIMYDGSSLESFIKEAKLLVKDSTVYKYPYQYQYKNQSYNNHNTNDTKKTNDTAKDSPKEVAVVSKKDKKRKGKKKKNNGKKNNTTYSSHINTDYEDYGCYDGYY